MRRRCPPAALEQLPRHLRENGVDHGLSEPHHAPLERHPLEVVAQAAQVCRAAPVSEVGGVVEGPKGLENNTLLQTPDS